MPAWPDILQRVLSIYAWAAIFVLIFFLWRVAYFYEHASGERLRHYLVLPPALLLVAGAVWYFFHSGAFVGEPVGDLLLAAGGAGLVVFGLRLHELMTGERKRK